MHILDVVLKCIERVSHLTRKVVKELFPGFGMRIDPGNVVHRGKEEPEGNNVPHRVKLNERRSCQI